MHAPGLQWRGATSAPFPGYMLIGRGEDFADDADLGLRRHRSTSTRRRSAAAATRSTSTRASAGRWAPSTPARSNGEPVTFRTTVHGPVIGYATVNGKKVAISSKRSSYGKDVARPALQPPALERSGARSEVVLQRGVEDPADVQLLLHRQQAHRRVHGRQAADPRQGRRPGPAHQGHRQVRVDRASSSKSGHPHGVDPEGRDDRPTGTRSSPRASARPTTSGAAPARSSGSTCSTRTSTGSQSKNGKWSLASVTSAMNAAATQDIRAIDTVPLLKRAARRAPRPRAPRAAADARPDGRLEAATAAAASTSTSTARSTIPARR